jgi:hypothetical protein
MPLTTAEREWIHRQRVSPREQAAEQRRLREQLATQAELSRRRDRPTRFDARP